MYQRLLETMTNDWLTIVREEEGTDFTNDRQVPDEVSCAFALSTLLNRYDNRIPVKVGTRELGAFMEAHPELFRKVPQPIDKMKEGWIWICRSGTNAHPERVEHGHCGVYDDEINSFSNDSDTGLWIKNWTRQRIRDYFGTYGGFNIEIYELIV